MRRTLLALVASAAFAPAAHAFDTPSVIFDAGVFGLRGDDHEEEVLYGTEYRYKSVASLLGGGISPLVGIQGVGGNNGQWYAYGGFTWDFMLTNRIAVSPNFAVSTYQNGDDGKDLGGPLEFRSGIEVNYLFENKMRLGMAVHHLSNASIYEDNDGVETFTVLFAVPANAAF